MHSTPLGPLAIAVQIQVIACAASLAQEPAPGETSSTARDLNQRVLILDTHVDTPTHAAKHPDWKFSDRHEASETHVDLPRLLESGLDAPFMVVYTPSRHEPPQALTHALRLCDIVHRWAEDHADRVAIARNPMEVLAAKREGRIAMVLCMENGSPILPGRLDLLRIFHHLGVRYISLAHFRTNHLCDSATDEPIYDGVSAFGRRVIEEANRLGILLDVSHISDDAVRDHLRYSKAPIIASHSNARAICNHPRNLPDDLLKAIAASGGVVQLNFAAQYVSPSYLEKYEQRKAKLEPLEKELEEKHPDDPERAQREISKLRDSQPKLPPPPLSEWFVHLEHIVRLIGVDHVGLGSDFDGIGASPKEIVDATSLLAVTEGLLARGWSEEDISKFYSGNLLRVWRRAELVAEGE